MARAFSEAGFADEVLASPLPVLVDFWRQGCAPCRILAPVIDKLADDLAGKVTIGKLDTDQHPGVAMAYDVMALPTLVLFTGGKEVGRTMGFQSEPQLRRFLGEHVR